MSNEQPKEQEEPIKKNQTVITNSDNHLTLYVNHSLLGMSPWDIQMMFSILEAGMSGNSQVNQVATIVMSPQHAKAFHQALTKNLEVYEKEFGVITVPDPSKLK